MKFLRILALMIVMLAGCQINGSGMKLAEGWSFHSLSAWKHITPNKIAVSPAGDWLYTSGERSDKSAQAGLIAIRLSSSRTQILVQGMRNANGVIFAPDGSLWIAEDDPKGVIWRMAQPDQFPVEQTVDPVASSSSHDSLAPFQFAGVFNHRAMTFSADGHYAYLADASATGALYRLDLNSRKLSVLHSQKGWLPVDPVDAVAMARQLGATEFAAIHDIERLPDGSLLLAESESGRILQLHDGDKPSIDSWLNNQLTHPEDLSWDDSRHWLWIVDNGTPASVQAWDGRELHAIITHPDSRFGGVLAIDGKVYVNLKNGKYNPSMTILLAEKKHES